MEQIFPLLPLRDIVVFPGMIVPLFVGRDKSVVALEKAMEKDKEIFLVAQLDPAEDDPGQDELYDIGVTATIMQLLKLPDGTVRVLVEGKQRAQLSAINDEGGDLVTASVAMLDESEVENAETKALMRSVVDQFEQFSKLDKKMPAETSVLTSPSALADAVAGSIQLKVSDKQSLLVERDATKRLEMVFAFMEGELGVLQVEKKIRGRVKRQMEKTQREYYLNEQMKAIQRELGNDDGDGGDEIAELQSKIDTTKLSKEAKTKANAELKKLRAMAPMSAESTVVRNYLDNLLAVPWGKKSRLKRDIAKAQAVLDEDHFALEKVALKRLRIGSSNIWRCRRALTSSKDRYCVWSVRLGLVKPLLAARLPRHAGANLSASRWAGCAMRPKFAAIAGLILALCQAKLLPI